MDDWQGYKYATGVTEHVKIQIHLLPGQYFFVHNQQYKHQTNMWDLLEVNNDVIKIVLMSIVNFE